MVVLVDRQAVAIALFRRLEELAVPPGVSSRKPSASVASALVALVV